MAEAGQAPAAASDPSRLGRPGRGARERGRCHDTPTASTSTEEDETEPARGSEEVKPRAEPT